jgi:small-conductance mechanosensitive channel
MAGEWSKAAKAFAKQLWTWEEIKPYAIGALILVAGYLVARSLSKAAERIGRQANSEHAASVGRRVVFYAVLIGSLLLAMDRVGIKISGLLAAAGIVTVAVSFAAQTSMSNLISGIFLLFDRPFSIHDTIKLDAILGTVIEMGMLSTKVRTFDNLVVRIPNETLLKSTIVNYSLLNIRRMDILVSVAYGTDLKACHQYMMDVMLEASHVLDEPAPVVLTELLGDNGIQLIARGWVVREDFVRAKSELTTQIITTLAERGVEMAYPRRVVHLRSDGTVHGSQGLVTLLQGGAVAGEAMHKEDDEAAQSAPLDRGAR